MNAFNKLETGRIAAGGLWLALLLSGCQRDVRPPKDLFQREQQIRAAEPTKAVIEGRVIDENGRPISSAQLRVGDRDVTTDEEGRYRLTGVPRVNTLLEARHEAFRPELLPLILETSSPALDTIVLHRHQSQSSRLLFAGDTAFGRRFLDPSEQTPRDELPRAGLGGLIDAGNPLPSTKRILAAVRPFFQVADWSGINFESPITRRADTPHPTKDYAFFSLPGSLPALRWLGVDWVGLGNNHIYDYLEQGLEDTLAALRAAKIPFSGAGFDQEEALVPHRMRLAGTNYSVISASSVRGSQHQVLYTATANKAGSADAQDRSSLRRRISSEVAAGFAPIVSIHGGSEYTYEPTPFFREILHGAVEDGAALVVAHHPHVLQGVERHQGRLLIHSLGNFAFDQDRLETMLSALAWVDMNGTRVERLRFTPIYLDRFRPRPIGGALADRLIRRMAESSSPYGMLVYPFAAQAWVSLNEGDTRKATRSTDIEVEVGRNGSGFIDLRRIAQPHESLSQVGGSGELTVQLGRDILTFGDFEEWDVLASNDGPRTEEASRWNFLRGGGQTCRHRRLSGAASACLSSGTRLAFRNRIRVWGDALNRPIKDVSLIGYAAADRGGTLDAVVRYQASEKDAEFGGQRFQLASGGSSGWRQFIADFNFPTDFTRLSAHERNPRAFRLSFDHGVAKASGGTAYLDELAVVSWDPPAPLSRLTTVAVPHPKDFVRVRGKQGRYRVTLHFQSFVPAAVSSADVRPSRRTQDHLSTT